MKINITVTLEHQGGPMRNSDQVFDVLAEEWDGATFSVNNEADTGDDGEYVVIDVQRASK